MKVNLRSMRTYFRHAKRDFINAWNDAKEIRRENNVFKDIKDLVNDIKEATESGKVYTAGVTDDSAKHIVDTSRKGLEAYAKANKINITFHTPQKPVEVGSNAFEKPLDVTVVSSSFWNSKIKSATIDGDINKTTVALKNKTVKLGDKEENITSSYEDTFQRRVFRTVEELKNEVNKK